MKLSVAFREQARPIIAYWALLLFAFSMFAASILSTDRFDDEDVVFLTIFLGVGDYRDRVGTNCRRCFDSEK